MSVGEIICYFAAIYLTLYFLCHISRPAKFYVKLIFYYFAIFSVTTVAIPFSLLHPGDPDNLLYASWMVHHIISPVFGLKWDVKNKELLKSKEPCVFVCNHQSALDISGMMYIWPLFHPGVPVLKKELLFTGPFGIFCWLCDCIFVDRCNSAAAYKILNKKITAMKDKKVKLWFFPEGTRNDKGTLLPFKKGAFHIATQTKVPIVPIVFSQYTDFYSISKKIFDRGTITVTVLPWVSTENLTASDVPLLTEQVREVMMTNLAQSADNYSNKTSIKNELLH
ncbi:1-acyl-sn-glycerol-3-phosphate acyltransferase beta isoform X2 [Parasteatoda tepidariorum]|uniref:1-acyl-sn-glycerol-3-phosphate acyltransferase beta isoform X2 n=1 Tax=Parasteatoda tepidariorum TaxID=114398 RepID=UPI00077FBE66|nr:1-acyl-sn-glycerol-3-phosphate acyltransferase beta isoform X1 [Parasteatoda tepidariorum]